MATTRTRRAKNVPGIRMIALVAVAVVIVGGSFYMASGSLTNPGSLLASALSAITGKPTVFIGKDGGSPAGSVKAGTDQILAIFDISSKNTTNWVTLHSEGFKITITSSTASPITVVGLVVSYKYCVSANATYGYGWKGGNCSGAKVLAPASVVKDGDGYSATYYSDTPIYYCKWYADVPIHTKQDRGRFGRRLAPNSRQRSLRRG
jgi:hypothetical protein